MVKLLALLPLLVSVGASPIYYKPSFNVTAPSFTTNVCDLEWFYCPKDPGCKNYKNSVEHVVIYSARGPIQAADLKPGDKITLVMTGVTSWKEVPAANYIIYDAAGNNMASGDLAKAMVITGNKFTLTVPITLDAATACGKMFEFGIDLFYDKAHGDPEGMCVQVSSKEYFKQASGKSDFALDCKDNGDGTWTPESSTVVGHPLPAPSCSAPKNNCTLNWFYCPNDPGCGTYSMSVTSVSVDVNDKTGIKAGDTVNMIVHGFTSLKAVPPHATYKIYDGAGKNAGQGNLKDVMQLDASSGAFTLTIPALVLDPSSVQGNVIEWGLDVFQERSGSKEAMCIQIASDDYVKMVQPKASPPFNLYCVDEGHGVFMKKTQPVPVHTAQCQLK